MNNCKNCKHYQNDPIGGQASGKCLDPSKIIRWGNGEPVTKPLQVQPMNTCSNFEARNG